MPGGIYVFYDLNLQFIYITKSLDSNVKYNLQSSSNVWLIHFTYAWQNCLVTYYEVLGLAQYKCFMFSSIHMASIWPAEASKLDNWLLHMWPPWCALPVQYSSVRFLENQWDLFQNTFRDCIYECIDSCKWNYLIGHDFCQKLSAFYLAIYLKFIKLLID